MTSINYEGHEEREDSLIFYLRGLRGLRGAIYE
jgi:hypothetical protein